MKRFIISILILTVFSNLYGQDLNNQRVALLLDSLKKAPTMEQKLAIYESDEVQNLDFAKSSIPITMAADIAKIYFDKGDREGSLYWLKIIEKNPIVYTWTWPIFYNKFAPLGDYQFLDKALFTEMEGLHANIRDSIAVDNRLFGEYNRKLYAFIVNKMDLKEYKTAYRHLDLLYKKYGGFQDKRNYHQYMDLLIRSNRSEDLMAILVSFYTSGKRVPSEIEVIKNGFLTSSELEKNFKVAVEAEEKNQRKTFRELIAFSEELYGKDIAQAIGKSSYTILSFWGTWCVPCIQSHPQLQKIYKDYKSDGLEILSLASETGRDTVKMISNLKRSIESQNLPWLHTMLKGQNKSGHPYLKYKIEGYPTKILIDNEGVILGKYTGESEIPFLERKLKELLSR